MDKISIRLGEEDLEHLDKCVEVGIDLGLITKKSRNAAVVYMIDLFREKLLNERDRLKMEEQRKMEFMEDNKQNNG